MSCEAKLLWYMNLREIWESKDEYDFVVTTNEIILEGQVVTFQGVVTLDKDFGAGYKYEIIVEKGTRK